MEQWGLDLYRKDAAAFSSFVDGAPTLTAPQLRRIVKEADGIAVLSAEQETVAKALGLDVGSEAWILPLE